MSPLDSQYLPVLQPLDFCKLIHSTYESTSFLREPLLEFEGLVVLEVPDAGPLLEVPDPDAGPWLEVPDAGPRLEVPDAGPRLEVPDAGPARGSTGPG